MPTSSSNTTYFWDVEAKSAENMEKATLTFIAGTLSFVACLVTTVVYFLLHKNTTLFNSMNHFFAFAFALGIISSCNYVASAYVRLYVTDVELLTGYCDLSTHLVLISTYPMLLSEMGYFLAAYKRISGAYDLGAKERKQREQAKKIGLASSRNRSDKNDNNNNDNSDEQQQDLPTDEHFHPSSKGNNRVAASSPQTNEENVDAAIEIVDSGEIFFRRYIGACLFVCLATAMTLKAALPTQDLWQTKFDPTDQCWCWIPTTDGDGTDDVHHNSREFLYIFIQLFVEVIPLLGTPLVGIASLILLYRTLGSLPRSAKVRVVYIFIFIAIFADSIFVRLQFTSRGASKFQAFAEPFIAFLNSITFLISEVYPIYAASRPRRLVEEDDGILVADDHDDNYHNDQNYGHGGGDNEWSARPNNNDGAENGDSTSLLVKSNNNNKKKRNNNNNNDDDDDDPMFQPSLAVAIEAGAFLRSAMSRVSQNNLQRAGNDDDEDEPRDGRNADSLLAEAAIQKENQRRSRRISQKLLEHSVKQKVDSTRFILTLFSFLNGFCDVWSFVSFGTFSTASVAANVGVISLAIAYSKWVPAELASQTQVVHHCVLGLLSILLPVIVAAVGTWLVVRENKIVDRRHSMIILGCSVVALFLTWVGSVRFFAISWFDAYRREPVSRYIAICGLSLFSGFQLAYHRIFLTLFKLPSEPFITSTILDFVGQKWLTPSATVILTAASAERFPTQLRKQVQSLSTLAYILGCVVSLLAGVYETGGAFGIAPILACFILLLTLDWKALEDQVLIPSSSSVTGNNARKTYFSGYRVSRNTNENDDQDDDDDEDDQNENNNTSSKAEKRADDMMNYSSIMFAREIEGIEDETTNSDRNSSLRHRGNNSNSTASWKPNASAAGASSSTVTRMTPSFSSASSRIRTTIVFPEMVNRSGKPNLLIINIMSTTTRTLPPLAKLHGGQNAFNLPRLPIPSLEATAARYGRSCHGLAPLASLSSKNSDKFHAELKAHLAVLDAFVASSGGKKIQAELIERDKCAAESGEYPFSYIEPIWDDGYLDFDDPLPMYVSPGYSSLPVKSHWTQAKVAAKLARSCAKWFIAAHEGQLPKVAKDGQEQCLSGLAFQMGCARKPGALRDAAHVAETMEDAIRYVTVLRKGEIFLVSLVNHDGKLRSNKSLRKAFETILAVTQEMPHSELPVPALTTTNRRDWFKARSALKETDPGNTSNLRYIEESLSVICLDEHTSLTDSERQKNQLTGYKKEVCNRWCDKHQLIVSAVPGDGFSATCEHAFSDAMVWSEWMNAVYYDMTSKGTYLPNPDDRVLLMTKNRMSAKSASSCEPRGTTHENGVVHLKFMLREDSQSHIQAATNYISQEVKGLKLVASSLPFGKADCKSKLRVSPDALCQASYHLAYARTHNLMAPTYEVASTSKFFHGRTETIRSATPEMNAFVNAAMASLKRSSTHSSGSSNLENSETAQNLLLPLLHNALEVHTKLGRGSMNGQGVDRHLLALKTLVKEFNDETGAAFFNHPMYSTCSTWYMQTSNVSQPSLNWFSISPVCARGYGIAYCVKDDRVNISVSSTSNEYPENNVWSTSANEDAERANLRGDADVLSENVQQACQDLLSILRSKDKL